MDSEPLRDQWGEFVHSWTNELLLCIMTTRLREDGNGAHRFECDLGACLRSAKRREAKLCEHKLAARWAAG